MSNIEKFMEIGNGLPSAARRRCGRPDKGFLFGILKTF
jgi:hypothetical protein